MTGPGTNTYLIGERELAMVDPGPNMPEHVDALERICAGRLRWILVTHTHRDHSPAAHALARRTGAQLVGNIIPNDGFQDDTFIDARALVQDEVLSTDEFTLRALLTPGHVSNHICFLVEEDALLMTGDHIMGGSTVVIVPPHGNMQHYIESLRRMLNYRVEHLAPGHGDLIANPRGEIEHLIAHRLKREAKVADALQRLGAVTIETLTPVVYDDVDPVMHSWAAMSLHAHLLKLRDDGRASEQDGLWRMLT
ncbi:MAG: MBL fold metallo-hydrolase [Gammaproteobacteria bacterium]|nr:MBL fold metallo-hydrolase [Gammaproteobacteria bacterium]